MRFSRARFLKDRKRAITKAVMDDDWSYAREYCFKYGVVMPRDEQVFKAGIYKAAHECMDISEDVKQVADAKCAALGFGIGITGV